MLFSPGSFLILLPFSNQALKAMMISAVSGTVPATDLKPDWRKDVEASINYESALPWTISKGFITIEFSGIRTLRNDGQPVEIKLAFSEQANAEE